MTISFPLPASDFASLMRKMTVRFYQAYNQQSSGLPSGEVLYADLAPPYWMAEIGLINMSNADAMAMQSVIESLDGGIGTFLLFDPRCEFPQSDPDGSLLAGRTITNTLVSSNTKEMKFTGFPTGFKIKAGDMFGFTYGPGGAYRALHRIVTGDTATGGGDTGFMEFRPHLADPDLATGKTMSFIRAVGKFRLLADAFEPGTARQMMTTGMTIKARQVP
jgi:hypothetical protein